MTAATLTEIDPLDAWWPDHWLPRRPYAADQLGDGVQRTTRTRAMGRRYVEVNPAAMSNLLVVDIDQPDSALRALSANGNHPMPNALVETPQSGHAHAVWALDVPVIRTEFGAARPLLYAAAVTEGLRRAVGGDAAYSGLMTKNPLHPDWHATLLRDDLRSLGDLAREMPNHMPDLGWRRGRPSGTAVGLSRNCAIFDSARRWAYREVRHHFGDPDGLERAVRTHVAMLNAEFSEPLPKSEVRSIAASIFRWITRRSKMWRQGQAEYERTFTVIQSARGRKSGVARATTAADRWAEVLELAESGMTYPQIGERLGISEAAVDGRLRRARRSLGS